MEGPPTSSPVNHSVGNGVYDPVQQPQKLDDTNARSLYVGNLDPNVNELMLAEVFGAVRPVVAIKIIPDKRQVLGGVSYGFVEFATHQDAELALQSLNGHRILGCEIRVNWAFTGAGQVHEDTSEHFHVFVGDLSAEVNDQVLAKAFSIFPTVSDARVMWDMTSGKSRGYGFVAFRERADAEKAIAQMNGEWLGSRAIRVNWANQKAAYPNKFAKHDSSLSVNGAGRGGGDRFGGEPLTYEAVRDQTAQYNTTVYVGNLTNFTTQEQLQALLQPYGFVMEFRMQPDRGFAFVKMDTHENAAMAITQVNGTRVNGRAVKCSWGKDKPTDPKLAFGALAAAAAANPAYSYPYVYGMPPPGQQYAVPGAAGQQPGQQPGQQQQPGQLQGGQLQGGQQAQQQQQVGGNPQQWTGFGYDNYAYYTNPNYAQHAQMMAAAAAAGAPTDPGSIPAAGMYGSLPDTMNNNNNGGGSGGY
ncbi:E3 ubiquitin-protein ligase pub1 [Coemansia aciculifera]|uniref:E3 ubiquitin-protein ligase pub1 n=1 Tax=Coemansia aciculifera TaxID=417176 RepID=A0ACC1M7U5_9FUNG|nr:E3 ubiquitin-protein ligase pub1 [Coemansia aciculifera]